MHARRQAHDDGGGGDNEQEEDVVRVTMVMTMVMSTRMMASVMVTTMMTVMMDDCCNCRDHDVVAVKQTHTGSAVADFRWCCPARGLSPSAAFVFTRNGDAVSWASSSSS